MRLPGWWGRRLERPSRGGKRGSGRGTRTGPPWPWSGRPSPCGGGEKPGRTKKRPQPLVVLGAGDPGAAELDEAAPPHRLGVGDPPRQLAIVDVAQVAQQRLQ